MIDFDKYLIPIVFGVIVISNLLMYLTTIGVSYMWSKYHHLETYPLSRHDVKNSLIVLIINILVAIPGLWLLGIGFLGFRIEEYFLIDLLLLFFGFDFLMYVVHRVSHVVWPFNMFHKKHHSHTYFNSISLYVMEPVEAILFGFLLTVAAYVFVFNIFSFIFFLILNWILGVFGHLNSRKTKQPHFLGNYVFHKIHHLKGNFNYGFYTVMWDRIFGTYYFEQKIVE